VLRRLRIPIVLIGALTGIVAAVEACASSGPRGETDRTPRSAARSLIWADEFRGPAGAKPNPRRWRFETGFGWGDGELQYYTRANARLDGRGHLAITGRNERYTDSHGATASYTSARLSTEARLECAYGRIEARVRVAAGQGLVTAFWALGSDMSAVGWPAAGELDILEVNGADARMLIGNLHGPRRGHRDYALEANRLVKEPLSARFHVYGINWSPGRIAFMLDHEVYAVRTRADLPSDSRWRFEHPFFLLLTLAIGGRWAGPPDATTSWPATVLVDWVRVWANRHTYCPTVRKPRLSSTLPSRRPGGVG
jgi:beta-glucanase (GH16 family)